MVGGEVLRQLQSARVPFRAAYFSKGKAEAARARDIEAVLLDYGRRETLEAAFKGCDVLFLLGPTDPNQTRLELNAVEAAKEAGLRRIVKLSVLGADEEAFGFARVHRPVEKAIESSGLAWTFLRPNSFMQDVERFRGGTIRAEGAFHTASGDARISHVDVRDIAAVAVKALTGPGHERKAYTLTGPEALTNDDLAGELTRALGRPIRHVRISPADMRAGMLAEGMAEPIVDMLIDLERYYREDGASRVANDIRQVTGRDAGRFASYARECAPLLQPT
ncbi:MAG: SDR family oxidoreductase [Planctomycetes bacterium]|nr:SDR family oxidoreductase [Planctomycetota bacterium]